MSYKFIYFDLDDTLLNHQSAEAAALRDVHDYFPFFDAVTPDDLRQTYHEVNSKQWQLYSRGDVNREQLQRNRFEQTLQQLGLDGSRYDEVGSFYMKCYSSHWQWMDGAEKIYHKVVQNYPVGILTNGFAETQRKKFKQFRLDESANCTVISEEVGALKPDPKVFQHATDLAQVATDKILYVGDSFSSDIKGGSQFGWKTAWFTDNENSTEQQKADFVFNDFKDLAKLLNV